ncbi:phosphatase PAP2 family protein [Vibrio caribbeanicus]|uniref:undecaprenyl-diphosphate phosphatase n=1 Tax=Vibrio caribbeanicus ATCC BAA-2122 TaxID=796620 RepID=E3BFV2_9VIBR|nr:phosphatase PAP2 family protein [Vibrio caribbeanicus]EFP98109.1 phospholipid phosphatase [Vibrio caribbeanicus ATCC BAA-2122]
MRSIESLIKLDLAFSIMCLRHKYHRPMVRLSRAISHTGDGHLYAVVGLLAFLFGGEQGKTLLVVGLLAFSIELPVYWLAKNTFKRERPSEISQLIVSFITPPDRYSLPSGHSAAAFLMALNISHFYPQLTLFAFTWAVLIAFSRVVLGVHFLSDVVLGAVLGLGCTIVSLAIAGG